MLQPPLTTFIPSDSCSLLVHRAAPLLRDLSLCAQAQRLHLHLPPFPDRCPKTGPCSLPCAHSSVPDLTPWLQLLQDRHHFHLVHLTASVRTGLRKFNPPPPPKHARNRPLNCPFLRQNSEREQLVLRALRLTINAKTELRLLIPKKCL